MSRPADGGPAFPLPVVGHSSDGQPQFSTFADGMSLRDWFAGKALAGYFAAPYTTHQNSANAEVAAYLYAMADAMIAESQRKR